MKSENPGPLLSLLGLKADEESKVNGTDYFGFIKLKMKESVSVVDIVLYLNLSFDSRLRG